MRAKQTRGCATYWDNCLFLQSFKISLYGVLIVVSEHITLNYFYHTFNTILKELLGLPIQTGVGSLYSIVDRRDRKTNPPSFGLLLIRDFAHNLVDLRRRISISVTKLNKRI